MAVFARLRRPGETPTLAPARGRAARRWSLAALVGLACAGCRPPAAAGVSPGWQPALSGDGARAVLLADDGDAVALWDRASKRPIARVGPRGQIVATGLDRHGRRVAVLERRRPGRRCTLSRIAVDGAGAQTVVMRSVRVCTGLVLAPDGRAVAVFGDTEARVFDGGRLARRQVFDVGETVTAAAFSEDGSRLAFATSQLRSDGADAIWIADVPTGDIEGPLVGHGVIVQALAFLPDGRLVSGGVERRRRPTAHLWSDGRPIPLPGIEPGAPITSLAVAPDGRAILGAGSLGCDTTLMLWALNGDGAPVAVPDAAAQLWPQWPAAVAFMANGAAVALGRAWIALSTDGSTRDAMFEQPESGISLCSSPVAWPR